jgi:hypothetical protein
MRGNLYPANWFALTSLPLVLLILVLVAIALVGV